MDNLESAGVYTLLDMHQDVLWEEPTNQGSHNGYWGVPPWIKAKLNHSSAQPYPYPLEHYPSGIMWGCGYFTDRITKVRKKQCRKSEFFKADSKNPHRVSKIIMTIYKVRWMTI